MRWNWLRASMAGVALLLTLLLGGCTQALLPLVEVAPAGQEPGATPSPGPPLHSVAAGETLHAIADQYGTTVTALVTANGLRGSRLAVGQELLIADPSLLPSLPPSLAYSAAAIINQGVTSRRSVALSFDAGADRGY